MAIDRHSETWGVVAKWATKQTHDAFLELARENISERDADQVRGRLAALKSLAELVAGPKAPPIFETPSRNYGF